jgi:hypothetical protein
VTDQSTKNMIKRRTTKNGRKVSTFVKNRDYSLYLTGPSKGVKDLGTTLTIVGINPTYGQKNLVKLDGRAISLLRSILTEN